MKKFAKKIAVYVSTFALAMAGILTVKAAPVKAAEAIDTTLHIVVKGAPEGVNQIGINTWGGAWVDSADWVDLSTVTTALSSWGWNSTYVGKIDMTKGADGNYTCTMKYDKDQYDSTDNHGVQIFMYGAENAAVAADYTTALFGYLGDTAVTDLYAIVDYTNVNGAEGGVVTFQSEAPAADDDNNTPSGDNDTPSGDNDTPSGDDNDAPSGDNNDAPSGEDQLLGDVNVVSILVLAVLMLAVAATVTKKKYAEE